MTVTDDEPILVAEHLSHSYLERFPALDDVSVSVQRGERLLLRPRQGAVLDVSRICSSGVWARRCGAVIGRTP